MSHEKIVLFDGTNLDKWSSRKTGGAAEWEIGNDGAMTVVPGSGDIICNELYGDAHIHVEFWLPYMPEQQGQGRANSGVYVHGCYEVQVLDNYGKEKACDDDCGAIYNTYKPLCNASLPPETWQTYDIYIRAPKFDSYGDLTEDGYITILFNGICIHNHTKLYKVTDGGITGGKRVAEGKLMLQDHWNAVRYRNIWIEKLDRDCDK